jgi:hypothetical protein
MTESERLDEAIQTALQDLQSQYGKKKDDYYGLVFVERVIGLDRPTALGQVTFGNHDLGIDGFHMDMDQGAFRVFQFKNSKSIGHFNDSFERLIDHGIPALIGDVVASPDHQPVVHAARSMIEKNQEQITQVFVDFVFRGNPEDAEQSKSITELQARLADKSWMLERRFDDKIPLLSRFLPFDGLAAVSPTRGDFLVRLHDYSKIAGPNGMEMHVGFVPLIDLHGIYSVLKREFLQRNIRFPLPPRECRVLGYFLAARDVRS